MICLGFVKKKPVLKTCINCFSNLLPLLSGRKTSIEWVTFSLQKPWRFPLDATRSVAINCEKDCLNQTNKFDQMTRWRFLSYVLLYNALLFTHRQILSFSLFLSMLRRTAEQSAFEVLRGCCNERCFSLQSPSPHRRPHGHHRSRQQVESLSPLEIALASKRESQQAAEAERRNTTGEWYVPEDDGGRRDDSYGF